MRTACPVLQAFLVRAAFSVPQPSPLAAPAARTVFAVLEALFDTKLLAGAFTGSVYPRVTYNHYLGRIHRHTHIHVNTAWIFMGGITATMNTALAAAKLVSSESRRPARQLIWHG